MIFLNLYSNLSKNMFCNLKLFLYELLKYGVLVVQGKVTY